MHAMHLLQQWTSNIHGNTCPNTISELPEYTHPHRKIHVLANHHACFGNCAASQAQNDTNLPGLSVLALAYLKANCSTVCAL
jgi:hypothetical protein